MTTLPLSRLLPAACLAMALAGPAAAQDEPIDEEVAREADEADDTLTTLTVIPEEVVSGEVAPTITVPGAAIGTITLEPGPGTEGSVSVGSAIDAATVSGFLGQILSGRPYTVFIPNNAALEAVPQDALSELLGDPEQLSTVLQGYVIEGNFDTDAALALIEEEGGEATLASLTGSPIVLATEGEDLTINGARVVVPNLGYAGLVAHIIDGAFLPEAPAE